MRYTQNYNWALPGRIDPEDDRADIEVLNDNFSGIDTVVGQIRVDLTSAQGSITSHIANLSNPHQTTAAQVGSYTIAQVDALIAALQAAVDEATEGNGSLGESLAAHLSNLNNPHQTTAEQVGAYTTAEVNELIADFLNKGGTWEPSQVVVTNPDGNLVVTMGVSTEELSYISGLTGNAQEQINAIASLTPAYELRGTILYQYSTAVLPDQDALNAQAISLIEAEYPNPTLYDTYVVSFTNNDETEGRVCGYAYYDGTTPNGQTGWILYYVTTTTVALADGTKAGIVRSSADISFTSGTGVVNHATAADLAEAAMGLVSTQIGAAGATSTDLNTYYGLEHDALFWAGAGNTVTNKPGGVDDFGLFVQRVSSGHTLQVLYASSSAEFSGLWTREYNASTWSTWRAPLADLDKMNVGTEVKDWSTDPSTWGLPISGAFPAELRVPQKVFGLSDAAGLPTGWANSTSGIITYTTTNFATLVLFRAVSGGANAEIAWRAWTSTMWSTWRLVGGALGTDVYPYDSLYVNEVRRPSGTLNIVSNNSEVHIAPNNSARYIATQATFRPNGNGVYTLGETANRWSGIYGVNGNFSGAVFAPTEPTDPGHLTTKSYVDAAISAGGGGGGKTYAKVVVGHSGNGYTAADVDFLCTGTNDDTVIQQAITAAGFRGAVKILGGTRAYSISGTISWNGCTLEGEGAQQTVFMATSTSATIALGSSSLGKIEGFYFQDIIFTSGSYTGYGCTFRDCAFNDCSVTFQHDDLTLDNCWVVVSQAASASSYLSLNGQKITISNCKFSVAADIPIGVLRLAGGDAMVNNTSFTWAAVFDGNTPAMRLDNGRASITGCKFISYSNAIIIGTGGQYSICSNTFVANGSGTTSAPGSVAIAAASSGAHNNIMNNCFFRFESPVAMGSSGEYNIIVGNHARYCSGGFVAGGTGNLNQLNIVRTN